MSEGDDLRVFLRDLLTRFEKRTDAIVERMDAQAEEMRQQAAAMRDMAAEIRANTERTRANTEGVMRVFDRLDGLEGA